MRDAAETLEYLMHIKQGSLHPKLTPIENIINNLKEAATGLPKGLYFPFTCRNQEWLSIEKVTTITAYCDKENIYSILKFPLATLPMYEITRDTITCVQSRGRFHSNRNKKPLDSCR